MALKRQVLDASRLRELEMVRHKQQQLRDIRSMLARPVEAPGTPPSPEQPQQHAVVEEQVVQHNNLRGKINGCVNEGS